MRFTPLLLSALLLTACAGGGGEWPGQHSEDPTAYDFPIVQKRWDTASRAPLGSAQDIAAITSALKRAHPDLVVREIRWLSATEVMALVVRDAGLAGGEELFYGALNKNGDAWQLVAWYDGSAT
jgi:hypothetical protein